MNDSISAADTQNAHESILPPARGIPPDGPFEIEPQSNVHGIFYEDTTKDQIMATSDFREVWKWGYRFRQGTTVTDEEMALAEKIANLATTLRDHGLRTETNSKMGTGSGNAPAFQPPSLNAISIMERLINIFASALTHKRPASEILRFAKMTDDLEQQFLRRVVTKRSRKDLFRPILMTVGLFITFTLLGLLLPVFAQLLHKFPDWTKPNINSLPSVWMIRTICLVIAGVFLGRMIFFALTHSGRINTMEEYWRLEPQINFPELSILFDVVVGIAAFIVFQTGFLTIAIGGEAGVSSANIMDSELIAVLFGAMAGMSRSAFLDRVKTISSSAIDRKPSD